MSIEKEETLLIFRIAGIAFAVPAQSVGSILMPPAHITHTPGSNRSTPGIFHHAEYTYAIIDLHQRFGIDTPRTGSGRLLLYEEGIRHFAFLVDSVVGLVRSEHGQWANLPHYLPQELFSIGFLYRDEIVLCSELVLLRNMHDVEPLRRHFEQLQTQQGKTVVENKTGSANPRSPEKKSDNITTTPVTASAASPAPEVEKKATAVAASHVAAAATAKDKPSVADADPLSAPPHTASGSAPEKRITTQHQAAPQKPLPRQRRGQASSRPHTPTAPPAMPETGTASYAPVATEDDSAWLWLLIFLLLLTAIPLGYWLWPAPAREQLQPPSTTQEPAVAMTEQPAVAVPLRIERDGNGTINLIIDRKAATSRPTPPAQQDESLAAAEIPATIAGATETPTTPTQQPIPEETTPSPVTQPEACDCTHIVVEGDTLWDIAEQYTGDAFNYPELANRSRIKNPDRIYPGDRVRIIIR